LFLGNVVSVSWFVVFYFKAFLSQLFSGWTGRIMEFLGFHVVGLLDIAEYGYGIVGGGCGATLHWNWRSDRIAHGQDYTENFWTVGLGFFFLHFSGSTGFGVLKAENMGQMGSGLGSIAYKETSFSSLLLR
jgi:hypothetical protein